MAAEVETLGTLERRLSMSVPIGEIERQVDARLKQLARNVKLPGFRPGKVPMKLVVQQYGPQVRSEVLGDAVQKAFGEAVKEANLKVAGYPRIEKKDGAGGDQALEFSATFEIFPEVRVGDLAAAEIERPQVAVDDAAVERTLQILRRQRTEWVAVERGAQDGDRLSVDFDGRIDGASFDGGSASGFSFLVGEGRMLPEFEAAARGLKAGESKSFEVKFPDDYAGKAVAGKTAAFSLAVKRVEEPKLPALDAEFAKRLGVADGNLDTMRAEIRANVEREVKKRIDAQVKSQALQRLLEATPIELPRALVQAETQQLVEVAAADLKTRGLKLENVPLDPQAFEANAKRRVALGLIVGELARAEKLQPKPAEVRALIEAEAQAYESPAEMVKWFYMQPQRLSEMESLALENNVVAWVLSKSRVSDKSIPFEQLMGGA
ncbi:MAG: trigger factor [Betaproteobacteria bacterium]|nr:MAG: trigger factor [Betaproteobacteria bacterium]